MSTVQEIIDQVVLTNLGLKDIKLCDQLKLNDLDVDSIEKTEIMVKLQKAFATKFDLKEFQLVSTMGDMYKFVTQRVA